MNEIDEAHEELDFFESSFTQWDDRFNHVRFIQIMQNDCIDLESLVGCVKKVNIIVSVLESKQTKTIKLSKYSEFFDLDNSK